MNKLLSMTNMHGNKLLREMIGLDLIFLQMASNSSIKSDFMFRKETGAGVLSETGIHTLELHRSSCKSAECIDDAVLRERELSFSDQHEKQTVEVIFITDAVRPLWSS